MNSWYLDLGNILADIGSTFTEVFQSGAQFHWIFLFSSVCIAFFIYCTQRCGKSDATFAGFLVFCFPKRVYAHRSARLDFKYFAVNTAFYGMFVAPLILTSETTANSVVDMLVALFGWPAEPLFSGGFAANLGVTAAVVIVADLGFFVAHYLQHRVPFLWEFHKIHHAAEVLHPVTLNRRHPIDTIIDVTLMGAASGTALGICAYLFGDSLQGVTILGTNIVLFVFRFAGSHLRHSHIRLSYGSFLDRILISPVLHQTHHSCLPQHVDKNFGGILSIWDRLAGTLYLPRHDEELVLGLCGGEHEDYNSVISLYVLPFIKIARRLGHLVPRLLSRKEMSS